MIINTKIDVVHLELINIFIKANDLVGIVVSSEPYEINGRFHMTLRLTSTFKDTSATLTFMGVRHSGILNMLDDYLIKCGVPWDAISPPSMLRQAQEEKEAAQNERFMANLEHKLKTYGTLKDEYSNK